MLTAQLLTALTLSVTMSTPVTFTAGLATSGQSALVANPNTATADGTATLVLTFTARDAFNNVAGSTNVNLTASGTGTTFGASSGTTDAYGQFNTTVSATVAQSESITATFGLGNTVTAGVAFVPGPASGSTSTLIVNPNSITADGTSALAALLTLRDGQGNPVSGATPTFSASGSGTSVTSGGLTNASGQASANYRTTLAQNENAMVTVAGITLAAPMAFTAGPVVAAASTLTANPNIVAGNGNASVSLVTTARDAQGNPVSGASVMLSASGGNTTFGAASGTTLGNGTYTTTVKSTRMQTQTITATIAGNVNETVSVVFTGSPNATTSSLVVNPNSQTVGPSNFVNATLTLKDSASNPLAGITPTWGATGRSNTIVSSGATSSSGVGTATYASTLAQSENITVTATGSGSSPTINLYQPVQFIAGSPNAATSYMYAIPAYQLANNSNTITASFVLLDTYRNAISGQTVTFSASGSNTTVSGATVTDSTGLAQATYKTGTVQNQNATGSSSGIMQSTPIMFTDVPAMCTLTANPNNQTANGNSAINLSATVTNSNNQPVPGIQVIFSSTGAAQKFAGQNVVTTTFGIASNSITSLYAGSNTLMAQAANVQCISQGNFLTRTPYCTGSPRYSTSNYATGSSPSGIGSGDFDGDGIFDLAIANRDDNTVSILLGLGTGVFKAQAIFSTGASSESGAISVADFNGDGKQDLAVMKRGNNTITILLGTGSGTFSPQIDYATGSRPSGLTIGDFNADGKLDLAVTNNGAGNVSVLTGTGKGTFQTGITYATGVTPSGIATGDFNGDGRQDLAISNNSDNTISILMGTSAGGFANQVSFASPSGPGQVIVGDFNGDGNQDLAVLSFNGSLRIFLGTGTGVFSNSATYTADDYANSLTVGDFNGDGNQDLAVSSLNNNTLGIFLGAGTGSFQNQISFPTGSNPASAIATDFNNDGKQDFAVTSSGGNTVRVYLNTCP
jgi:hypothetical protein